MGAEPGLRSPFAEDRTEALEAFKANSPVVTLLDLGLPPHPNEMR